jgi:hypothetical protein
LRSSTLTVIEARIDPSRYADQFDAIRELWFSIITLLIADLERSARLKSTTSLAET